MPFVQKTEENLTLYRLNALQKEQE